jgi:hypothetical protein
VLLLVDRLQKDKEPYVQHCVAAFQAAVAALVPTITDAISLDVEAQLTTAGRAKVHTHTPTASSGTQSRVPAFPCANSADAALLRRRQHRVGHSRVCPLS